MQQGSPAPAGLGVQQGHTPWQGFPQQQGHGTALAPHGGYGSQYQYGYASSPSGPEPSGGRSGRSGWWPGLLAGALAGAIIGGGTAWAVAASAPSQSVISSSADTVIQNPETATTTGAAAAKALPSVVTISVASTGSSGSGSGIVLDKEGHILTNQHVATLAGKTSKGAIAVLLSDGRVLSATLVGQDPLYDLAVIKVEAEDLTPITWADMSKLNVGDTTVAIGAPLGLPNSVSDGVVSNLTRSIPVASSAVPKSESDETDPFTNPNPGGGSSTGATGQVSLNVIQTDAAINHGNSGGALVNGAGELIGVNVAIYSPSEESGSIGLGFAVRGDIAQRVAKELIEKGVATHGQLGVTVVAAQAKQGGSSTGFTDGAQVRDAPADSPAGKAGMQAGDVIVKVGDKRVVDATDVTATVRSYAAGSEVVITVKRDGKAVELKVTLGSASVG